MATLSHPHRKHVRLTILERTISLPRDKYDRLTEKFFVGSPCSDSCALCSLLVVAFDALFALGGIP